MRKNIKKKKQEGQIAEIQKSNYSTLFPFLAQIASDKERIFFSAPNTNIKIKSLYLLIASNVGIENRFRDMKIMIFKVLIFFIIFFCRVKIIYI
jgi:hypothetical protein